MINSSSIRIITLELFSIAYLFIAYVASNNVGMQAYPISDVYYVHAHIEYKKRVILQLKYQTFL